MAKKIIINPAPVYRRLIASEAPGGVMRPVWRFSIPLGVDFFLPQVGNIIPFNLSDSGDDPGVDFFTFISAVNVARPGSVYYYKPDGTPDFSLDMPLADTDTNQWWIGPVLGIDDMYAKATGQTVAVDLPVPSSYGYFYDARKDHVPVFVVGMKFDSNALGLVRHYPAYYSYSDKVGQSEIDFANYPLRNAFCTINGPLFNQGWTFLSSPDSFLALDSSMFLPKGEHRLFVPDAFLSTLDGFFEAHSDSYYAIIAEVWEQ